MQRNYFNYEFSVGKDHFSIIQLLVMTDILHESHFDGLPVILKFVPSLLNESLHTLVMDMNIIGFK